MFANEYFTINKQNNSHILLHIPHSSLYFPKKFSDDYFLSKEELEQFIILIEKKLYKKPSISMEKIIKEANELTSN